jgi:hypothetical protein
MDYDKEIQKIEIVINQLKNLKSELAITKKKSQKAFECNGTIRQRDKTTTELNWQCMHLDKCRKSAWKAIVENVDVLEVSLEETEYNPSPFHKYKG